LICPQSKSTLFVLQRLPKPNNHNLFFFFFTLKATVVFGRKISLPLRGPMTIYAPQCSMFSLLPLPPSIHYYPQPIRANKRWIGVPILSTFFLSFLLSLFLSFVEIPLRAAFGNQIKSNGEETIGFGD
jgi:hypothetical protein